MKIIECSRDAMQGIHHFIPTEAKIAYINTLLKVGFDTLDCGSFVSPKAIPQMADTWKVIPRLDLSETDTKLLVIVANERGAAQAVEYEQIDSIGFPFSISETFQLRNTNATQEQAFERVQNIYELCLQKNKELKLLFIGTISEDKGVDDLIELNRRLASKTVDFYGYTKEQKYLNNKDFNYKGVLDPAQVLKTMQSYDYLVLPTTWYGEGYPGVIIEAFSIGLPVISTNFRAIPELITHDYNGFLVEPGNVDSLISLVSLIEEGVDYSSLSAHSKALFLKSFESNLLHKAFFKKLEQLG